MRRTLVAMTLAGTLVLVACTTSDSGQTNGAQPDSRDGSIPAFSNPTEITNPLLPLSNAGTWLYEGTMNGRSSTVEISISPLTRIVAWNGSNTETLVVRRRTFVEGALVQSAVGYYAQGDDGGVWTFGEDVENFSRGRPADTSGSWLAGEGGTVPALAMPSDPAVDQVFHQDVPGQSVIERDRILSVTETASTPDGQVQGAVQVEGTQPDGTSVDRLFAPGVGEVLTRGGRSELRLVAINTDGAESAVATAFSNPTAVDNPLFGVTGVDYRLYRGKDEGEPLRIEVAPTGETKTIEWTGGSTDTVVSQFIATSERSMLEVAYDWFAQDDAGNVWYFGEDVFNYAKGVLADTNGSWIAGGDGPPGMIMPADPAVGMRFNPEDIPGMVFETVDVRATDRTQVAAGQPVDGAVTLHELLDDGTEEFKTYAPGYGNVTVRVPGVEYVELVYALPNDAIDGPVPAELTTALQELRRIADGAGSEAPAVASMRRWLDSGDPIPPLLAQMIEDQLAALTAESNAAEKRLVALDAAVGVTDAMRLYTSMRDVDLEALDITARRMILAANAHDAVGAGDATALAAGITARNPDQLPQGADAAVADAEAGIETNDLQAVKVAATSLIDSLGRG